MSRPQHHLIGFGLMLQLGLGLGLMALSGGACSSSSPSTSSSGGATGSSGGTSGGSGGATASDGTTGSGGATASGGTTASGGATGSGGATTSSGGASASGGATGSGGTTAGGGTIGSGGAAGASPSGGAGGGATANGGTTGGNAGRGGGGGGRMGGGAGRMGDGGRDGSGAGGSTIPATMTLTSPVLMEGGMFPANITCADAAMGSPELDWTPGPAGTMSYAIVMTDLTQNIFHWAIWNIPAPGGDPPTITLKAGLAKTAMLSDPAGAQQTSLMGSGYFGPCPNGTEHTYQFEVYAIPATTLSGNTTSVMNVRDAARSVAIATGTLSGKSSAKRP